VGVVSVRDSANGCCAFVVHIFPPFSPTLDLWCHLLLDYSFSCPSGITGRLHTGQLLTDILTNLLACRFEKYSTPVYLVEILHPGHVCVAVPDIETSMCFMLILLDSESLILAGLAHARYPVFFYAEVVAKL